MKLYQTHINILLHLINTFFQLSTHICFETSLSL